MDDPSAEFNELLITKKLDNCPPVNRSKIAYGQYSFLSGLNLIRQITAKVLFFGGTKKLHIIRACFSFSLIPCEPAESSGNAAITIRRAYSSPIGVSRVIMGGVFCLLNISRPLSSSSGIGRLTSLTSPFGNTNSCVVSRNSQKTSVAT